MAPLPDLLGRTPPEPSAQGAAGLPAWAQTLFASPLRPARVDRDEVLVWAIVDDASAAVISDQFKAQAGDYHERYAASDHFEGLFRQALETTGARVAGRPLILDLGSGSGVNSIVPCRRLFPDARCVATDLSGELLGMLGAYLRDAGDADQVVCVQMDAMSSHVAPGAFDLVTGAAILHHLERPLDGLAAAARALKPGGVAIFFEPFDGWAVVRLAYERILAEAELRRDPLDSEVERALRRVVVDIAARTAPDPASPQFRALDDKWLFSRDRIFAMAAKAGFDPPRIVPHHDQPDLYQAIVSIQLRLGGVGERSLPDWAQQILRSFDEALTAAFKRSAMLEGTIVLTKPA